jgi:hypothetical protein
MKVMRCAFLSVMFAGIVGCGFMDSQLGRGPNGEDPKLVQEVKAAQPLLGAYGNLALAAVTLLTGIYGAFHSKGANDGVKSIAAPDEPKPPA